MKVLVTGASGYIGGSVATYLAKKGLNVSGLVRNSSQAVLVEPFGIQPVLGNLDHIERTQKILKNYDAIIHCADSDNVGFVVLALETLANTGKVFIHTSGSSIVSERGNGGLVDGIHNEENFTFRPEKASRVQIDRLVLAAGKQNGLRTVVITPTMIYGEGLGPKKTSIQLPMLRAVAEELGAGVKIGEGSNVWSNVHIADLVELYELVLRGNDSGEMFFAENGEASFCDIAKGLHRSLGSLKPLHTLTVDEAIDRWGAGATLYALASNSRVTSMKARQKLKWNPRFNNLQSYL